MQLRKVFRQQVKHGIARRHCGGHLDLHALKGGDHGYMQRGSGGIMHGQMQLNVGGGSIGQGQAGDDLRIAEGRIAGFSERHALPQSGVAVSYGRHPIPAFGRNKGRTIDAQGSAIRTGATLDRLLLRYARMGRGCDPDSERVDPVRPQEFGYIEVTAAKGPANLSQTVAVEPHVGGEIDSRKMQGPAAFERASSRRGKLYAIPVVMLVQGLGNREVVQTKVRVRIDAPIDHRGEDRAGNGGW